MKPSRYNWSLVFTLVFFLVAVLAVGVLQYVMLAPHLKYGFADVDWTFLYRYKSLPTFSFNQIINEWKASGVYTYQTYYIGIQEMIFGHQYQWFHLVTNIFRYLSVITLFPVILLLSKNRLLALVTTIIYGVSYTAIGAMYTVVTSGIYLAITVLNIFFVTYIYSIRKRQFGWWWMCLLFGLFFTSLFLSTERLYPIFPLILFIELFIVWQQKFNHKNIYDSAKRLMLVMIPLLLGLLYRPYAANNVQFLGNTKILFERILEGNWHLVLIPFISLGGLFVPREYWNVFGVVNDVDFIKYSKLYLINFGVTFTLVTLFLAWVSARRPVIFILRTMILVIILGLGTFFLINHRLHIPLGIRMNFDPQIYLIPGLIGEYILVLSYAFFEEWRAEKYRMGLSFYAFFGIVFAFLFISMTWLPAEPGLIFTSVHRYLTIPGMGMSLFVGVIILFIYYKISSLRRLSYLAAAVFLLIVPIIIVNAQVTQNYFKYELEFAGTDGHEHNRMKSKLWSYLDDMDTSKQNIFYFDESLGKENGYFQETTLLAGFNFWMMLWKNDDPQIVAMPELIRSSLLCPSQAVPCLDVIKKYIKTEDGRRGIIYNKVFYPPERIYAFRLVNRDVMNIRTEFLNEMGLTLNPGL